MCAYDSGVAGANVRRSLCNRPWPEFTVLRRRQIRSADSSRLALASRT